MFCTLLNDAYELLVLGLLGGGKDASTLLVCGNEVGVGGMADDGADV